MVRKPLLGESLKRNVGELLQAPLSRIKVGTSGYSYSWNEGKPTPFRWYVAQGFETVEINASFYRFPVSSWVNAWLRAPRSFDFSIKVHRSITHNRRLRPSAVELWTRFRGALREMEGRIAFWLFQMPGNFAANPSNVKAVRDFFDCVDLRDKAVLEFRDPLWWREKDVCEEAGVVFCSVDAPELPREIVALNDAVYMRLHGRTEWYSYVYNEKELREIVRKISSCEVERKYIYLNNDHGMIPNGKRLMELASEILSR